MDFAVPADHREKLKESENDKYRDLARQLKIVWNAKVTLLSIIVRTLGTVAKLLRKELADMEIKAHPNNCIFEIGQNTEKTPGDLRRFAVTQTPLKDHNYMAKKRKL